MRLHVDNLGLQILEGYNISRKCMLELDFLRKTWPGARGHAGNSGCTLPSQCRTRPWQKGLQNRSWWNVGCGEAFRHPAPFPTVASPVIEFIWFKRIILGCGKHDIIVLSFPKQRLYNALCLYTMPLMLFVRCLPLLILISPHAQRSVKPLLIVGDVIHKTSCVQIKSQAVLTN